jgi:hypothetical protein
MMKKLSLLKSVDLSFACACMLVTPPEALRSRPKPSSARCDTDRGRILLAALRDRAA